MNFLQKVLLYQGGKVRYGTAGTTTNTTLASSGGLLINIDSATGDTPITTSGFVEDEKYGLYAFRELANVSAEIDTAVTRTGTRTAKISNTNAAGKSHIFLGTGTSPVATTTASRSKYGIPIKASTKYKLGCWVKTNNAAASSVYISFASYTDAGVRTLNTSVKLSGTNDWTYRVVTATTGASDTTGMIGLSNDVAGNISDAWFDINSMTLEEVIEPVANSLVTPSPSLVSFTAVGSTDNIDQSLDTGGAAAFTYVPLVAISETATNRQTFVPTKSKVTRIGVWVVNKGTGNWTLTVHDASNVVQATATIANASLTNGAFNYFTVPCNVTALSSYHFHVTSTVLDGNLKSGVTLDCEGASYIENYYKPTTNFKISQNNFEVDISSDEEGFIEGSVLGISTGTWSFTDPITAGQIQNNMYFSRSTGCTFSGNTVAFSGAGQNYILKVNLGLVGSGDMTYTLGFATNNTISYSYDNIAAYTSVGTLVGAGGSVTIPMNGYSTVYIKNNANATGSITNHSGTCPVTTSGLSVLKNYPTNKDIIKQYATTLGGATTSATYRATKWGFPAIEYSEIDQSQLTFSARTGTGSGAGLNYMNSQSFTPTESSHVGVTLYKKANVGTPTGDLKFDVRTDNAGSPSSTILATYTMPLATWNALSVNAEFTVNLPCTLTPATVYHYVLTDTVAEVGTNNFGIGTNGAGGYAGGINKISTDGGTTWTPNGTTDIYFKTLFADTYQFLDVDTTATGSTVAFSELGTSYTTVADGASLAISSTSTPNIFVKANITANRLYSSSNDYNANSDKDGSLKQTLTYQIVQ